MSSQATTTNGAAVRDIPNWRASGDWFDVCKCSIPCPCTFAQTPTYGDCDGIMAYHIKEGNYGEVSLSGLNVLILDSFKGNAWAGNWVKINVAIFFDESRRFYGRICKAIGRSPWHRICPNQIWDSRWFILLECIDTWKSLCKGWSTYWSYNPPGKRVQTINPPGSEVGPGAIATWGKSIADQADAMGFKWERNGKSSKHFPFDWTGP